MLNFHLVGCRKSDNAVVFWTGKAGEGFADTDRNAAFSVSSELGERRMETFNAWNGPVVWVGLLATNSPVPTYMTKGAT